MVLVKRGRPDRLDLGDFARRFLLEIQAAASRLFANFEPKSGARKAPTQLRLSLQGRHGQH